MSSQHRLCSTSTALLGGRGGCLPLTGLEGRQSTVMGWALPSPSLTVAEREREVFATPLLESLLESHLKIDP